MSNPVWGLLEKAQDDPQTILQAIAELIAAHEADAEAHLGTGEALQSHRASEIIDHAANSVVRDKLEFDRFAIDDMFATLDGWDTSAGVSQMGIGDVEIYAGPVINDIDQMYTLAGEGIEGQAALALNPVWQTRIKILDNTEQDIYIGQILPAAEVGYGFKIHDGTLYAVYFDDEGAEQLSEIGGLSLDTWVVLSCEVTNGGDIVWKLDGVQEHSITDTAISESDAFGSYYVKALDANSKIIHIQAFHFDADFVS